MNPLESTVRRSGAALGLVVIAAVVGCAVGVPTMAAAPGAVMVRSDVLAAGSAPIGAVRVGSLSGRQQLRLSVVLPPSNSGQLHALLRDLHDPKSSRFHRWLVPGQFQQEFGPSTAAVAAVESWLHGVGLTLTSVWGSAVVVTAAAAQVSAALGTPIDQYRQPSGQLGYLARSAPLVPQSLAGGQITAILGLNTVATFSTQDVSKPAGTRAGPSSVLPQSDGLTPCVAAQSAAGSSYYTLDALGAAYGVGSLLSHGQNGHGQTIALYELASHSSPDLASYEGCFGLTNPVTTTSVDGGGGAVGGNGTVEADLDLEQAATQAPSASLISYEGPNTILGATDTWGAIVTADVAQVISTSWGMCEPWASTYNVISAQTLLFEQAATQGQTVLAAAGDSGSEDCFRSGAPYTEGEYVDYPASDPSVTAVGGTSLLGPGSEVTWNWCQGAVNPTCANSFGGTAAGGGGMSRYLARPANQPNILTWGAPQPCGLTCREVPDISANAGVGMIVYANGGWAPGGGTSFAAPFIAGLVADRNNGCTTSSGLWTPSLYQLAAQGSYGTALTDITSGDNDMTGSTIGAFAATSGYDAATGLGSPLADGLSCPEVNTVSAGYSGSQVTVIGLGLEHATISFGGTTAHVLSANATQATVVVPAGSGTVTVSGTSVLGTGAGANATASFTYGAAPPPPPPPPPPRPVQHGYWLVGSDGGIFTFGSAQFYGSTGSLILQRPVVGMTPTSDHGGYWLVASDGGVFAFGDSGYYGSIPGLGIAPAGAAGAGLTLNAPIAGIVPSADGGGYFMVASDGGVFAFGDAHFAGSCPGIGGCVGQAVAVAPDATGNGYWLVTSTGAVYAFGDAPYLGAPGDQGEVTSAARTPDGRGYWILFYSGVVAAYGDAPYFGEPASLVLAAPTTAIFSTADNRGYWVAGMNGAVYAFGDAPNDGGMVGHPVNGEIIAAVGW